VRAGGEAGGVDALAAKALHLVDVVGAGDVEIAKFFAFLDFA
jgi:hypothetical protein